MSTTKVRVKARRSHCCTECGKSSIAAGDIYLRWKVYPGEEGNKTHLPTTVKQCAFCATEGNEDYLLQPLPDRQDHQVYTYAMQHGLG